MGLLDRFRRQKSLSASPEVLEALRDRQTNFYVRLGGTNQEIKAAFERGQAASYSWIYAKQPAVRAVVDFIARNVAQLSLKLFERVSDTERVRREDHPAALTMANPDGEMPSDAFIFGLVADFLVYDNAYVLKLRNPGTSKRVLVRVPPAGVTVSGGRFRVDFYRVWRRDGTHFDVQPADMLHWKGYNPDDPLLGLSKLETLREELTGDAVLQTTLTQLAKTGLRGGHIERPVDAPDWSEEARKRFQESWRNQKAGREDAVLEEGMKFVKDAISPQDAELLASRRFTVEEVARVYGVPTGAVGLQGTVRQDLPEQRKQVYADVLPPITNALAAQLDVSILQAEFSEPTFYFEFDLNEKLRGDAETRFQAITAATGRPWLTINEVRAMENKPPIDGGDELTIPLNVALAGPQGNITAPQLPAPNVMPPQNPLGPPQDGSHRQASLNGHQKQLEVTTKPRMEADMARQRRYIDEVRALLQRFYHRQAQTLRSKAKNNADTPHWNKQLADDLEKLLKRIIEAEGGTYVARLGGNDFDRRLVEHYIRAMAEGTAEGLNSATQRDIVALGTVAALERAKGQRADVAGANIGARATLFARQEAAKQSPNPERRMQTWIKDTERHASLNGKSVPLGSDWGGIEPGSEPNCACSASIG